MFLFTTGAGNNLYMFGTSGIMLLPTGSFIYDQIYNVVLTKSKSDISGVITAYTDNSSASSNLYLFGVDNY